MCVSAAERVLGGNRRLRSGILNTVTSSTTSSHRTERPSASDLRHFLFTEQRGRSLLSWYLVGFGQMKWNSYWVGHYCFIGCGWSTEQKKRLEHKGSKTYRGWSGDRSLFNFVVTDNSVNWVWIKYICSMPRFILLRISYSKRFDDPPYKNS